MRQDVLHIRDAVSKTITVSGNTATIISEFDDDELVVPADQLATIADMFNFAYNRADEFAESTRGVSLSISGGQYPEQIGDKAQSIYNIVKG